MHREELEKSHTCISYHIQAFQRQAENNEKADMTEPCKMCPYNKTCDFKWFRYITQAIPQTKYRLTLAKGCMYQLEDIDQ